MTECAASISGAAFLVSRSYGNSKNAPSVTGEDPEGHLETVARAHLMAGRPEEAARVHREIISIYSGHARPYDSNMIP